MWDTTNTVRAVWMRCSFPHYTPFCRHRFADLLRIVLHCIVFGGLKNCTETGPPAVGDDNARMMTWQMRCELMRARPSRIFSRREFLPAKPIGTENSITGVSEREAIAMLDVCVCVDLDDRRSGTWS